MLAMIYHENSSALLKAEFPFQEIPSRLRAFQVIAANRYEECQNHGDPTGRCPTCTSLVVEMNVEFVHLGTPITLLEFDI